MVSGFFTQCVLLIGCLKHVNRTRHLSTICHTVQVVHMANEITLSGQHAEVLLYCVTPPYCNPIFLSLFLCDVPSLATQQTRKQVCIQAWSCFIPSHINVVVTYCIHSRALAASLVAPCCATIFVGKAGTSWYKIRANIINISFVEPCNCKQYQLIMHYCYPSLNELL